MHFLTHLEAKKNSYPWLRIAVLKNLDYRNCRNNKYEILMDGMQDISTSYSTWQSTAFRAFLDGGVILN
jgi:hypothetical protein